MYNNLGRGTHEQTAAQKKNDTQDGHVQAGHGETLGGGVFPFQRHKSD